MASGWLVGTESAGEIHRLLAEARADDRRLLLTRAALGRALALWLARNGAAAELIAIADALEAADEVDCEPGTEELVADVLFQLATPEINAPVEPQTVRALLERLEASSPATGPLAQVTVADGSLLELRAEAGELVLRLRDWTEAVWSIRFSGVVAFQALDAFGDDLSHATTTTSGRLWSEVGTRAPDALRLASCFAFWSAWGGGPVLEVVADGCQVAKEG